MQFLTPKQVCQKIALSRATLDRMVAQGRFPKPMKLTERRMAYEAQAVETWMAEQVERV